MSIQLKRLEKLALKELSIILEGEAKNPYLHYITITEVRITNDLSFMTVYYTFYQGDKAKIEKALEESNAFLRSSLAPRLNARKMPELIFKFDTSLEYGNHIEKILMDLEKENKEKEGK